MELSFRLQDDFVAAYEKRPVGWGFDIGGGNSLGELTFYTKYSRLKDDGTKERWHETCRRVIEGMFSIQKDHCVYHRIPWNAMKAKSSAEEAFDRMFAMKWLPPGRGLQHMGTPIIKEIGSAPLQNCAFLSTKFLSTRNPTLPFIRLMEMSMLGVGVGFDTLGAGNLFIHEPAGETQNFVVEDSREGWCDSVDALLRSHFLPHKSPIQFDYSQIRPEGAPLKRFGGTAAGPEPLKRLHRAISALFEDRSGQEITSTDIVDINNLIGKCVVAGSSRRSAELSLGDPDDKEFLNLKNWEVNPKRMGADGWGNLSNNSIAAETGGNYDHLIDLMTTNGEPGLVYLDLARRYGRLIDPPNDRDYRVMGVNPCSEQTLENNELCTLVEVFPTRCTDKADFLRTLKFAYLYGKSVTLLPTHWPETNEVMTRNRRIGTSMTGIAQFVENRGWSELRSWSNDGYSEIKKYDIVYSEWLGVRESIKTTSVKPSGTVSLLAGVWPGVHWPVSAGDYIRRTRERVSSPIVPVLKAAGYPVEPDVMDPEFTVVISFPTRGPEGRSERQVPVWEKVHLAANMQRYWSDNAVSATFTFLPEETNQIGSVVKAFDGQLKTMSFLPLGERANYAQLPYESVSQQTFKDMREKVLPIDWQYLYAGGQDVQDEKFCTNDRCEIF